MCACMAITEDGTAIIATTTPRLQWTFCLFSLFPPSYFSILLYSKISYTKTSILYCIAYLFSVFILAYANKACSWTCARFFLTSRLDLLSSSQSRSFWKMGLSYYTIMHTFFVLFMLLLLSLLFVIVCCKAGGYGEKSVQGSEGNSQGS